MIISLTKSLFNYTGAFHTLIEKVFTEYDGRKRPPIWGFKIKNAGIISNGMNCVISALAYNLESDHLAVENPNSAEILIERYDYFLNLYCQQYCPLYGLSNGDIIELNKNVEDWRHLRMLLAKLEVLA